MRIVAITTDDNQWQALTAGTTDIEWINAKDNASFNDTTVDALFIFKENISFDYTSRKPVFINSVATTLQELNTPVNVLRFNGWDSFLQRNVWEVAGTITNEHSIVAEKLNKKLLAVKDEPGLISARIIAMIINEAYFALGDNVSTINEVDIAMKLGTNYPYGPFEWATKIGLKNIYQLLQKLSVTDKRYQPAPALVAAIIKQ